MIERIRQLIETLGFSQLQFADQIGVHRTIINHILSGRNKVSLDVAVRILGTFKQVSPDWLLSGTGAMLRTSQSDRKTTEPAPETKKVDHITIYYTDSTYINYYPEREGTVEGRNPSCIFNVE